MELTRAPGFRSPDPAKFDRDNYKSYIEECLPNETPQMFGLHPNAEIGYLTSTANILFKNLADIQESEHEKDEEEKVDFIKEIVNKFLEQLPENFNMKEIKETITEIDPYIIVSLQECERMNTLLDVIRKSLNDLEASLTSHHSSNQNLEELTCCLSLNKVPFSWERVSYKSNKNLSEWFHDLLLRVSQIRTWVKELKVPHSLWISGLFIPNSFLTAVKQATARKQNLSLDNIVLQTEVTNMLDVEEVTAPSENGMYIHGLFFEGAQWEKGEGTEQGYLAEMTPNVLHPPLPVMNIIAVQMYERNTQGFYTCPVYYTSSRSFTFIFEAYLKMKNEDDPESTWILAGVALVMSPE